MYGMCWCVQEFEKQVSKEMQQVTEYFGEGYDATDPSKVLRVIRDFMTLFDKSIFEIKVCTRRTAHVPKQFHVLQTWRQFHELVLYLMRSC